MIWTGVETYIGTVCGMYRRTHISSCLSCLSYKHVANRTRLACLPSLKPILNLILYGSVYPKTYYRSNVSDAQTIQEIAEAAKRRYHQRPRDASIPSAYLFASMTGAMDIHTFEQLSGTEASSVRSVRECTTDDIEMEMHGENLKESRQHETKRQDGT